MKKTLLLLGSFCVLAACNTQTPLPQNTAKSQPVPALDKSTRQGTAIRYLCKDEKEVRVFRNVHTDKKTGKKSKAKSERITLTFEGVTERLIFTVSESGRKYTSIHWHWYETNGNNRLTNSLGEILADQCVEQAASVGHR